eukprot:TRINITY_DN14084_c0_g1_i12.p3 TRINITY_DN14084_c0_g1~~TRINITY_DN14084_c0_g1_i12.p3  ORF type:complete len:123 (-),score=6.35 TRINITY_DN14084_c0_g1_i12:56-424(-)
MFSITIFMCCLFAPKNFWHRVIGCLLPKYSYCVCCLQMRIISEFQAVSNLHVVLKPIPLNSKVALIFDQGLDGGVDRVKQNEIVIQVRLKKHTLIVGEGVGGIFVCFVDSPLSVKVDFFKYC